MHARATVRVCAKLIECYVPVDTNAPRVGYYYDGAIEALRHLACMTSVMTVLDDFVCVRCLERKRTETRRALTRG